MLTFFAWLSRTTQPIMLGIPRSRSGLYLAVVMTRPAASPKMILGGESVSSRDLLPATERYLPFCHAGATVVPVADPTWLERLGGCEQSARSDVESHLCTLPLLLKEDR